MPDPLSPEVLRRLHERLPPPPARKPLPWLQILCMLFAFGVAGWGAFQLWRYRLPQEHDFTDQAGHAFHATLQARNHQFAQLLLPGSATPRYLPLKNFSTADQDFLRHTKAELTLKFPLDYTLTSADGQEQLVRLEARDNSWVKITLPASHFQTCLPLDQLSPADRAFVAEMPLSLNLFFPMDYVLTGPPQSGAKVHFLGRTPNFAEFQIADSPAKHCLPIAKFSTADQLFLRHLPATSVPDYPVDYPLAAEDGHALPGPILDHNYDVVALQMPGDGSARFYPIKRLSEDGRTFLHEYPGRLSLSCPLECTIADAQGQTSRVRVLSRATNVLKVAGANGAPDQFLSFAGLSLIDQEVFNLLPIGFTFAYPIEYTLVDQLGRALPAKILGRTDADVRFRLASGAETTYPLEKLSPDSQKFIRQLPPDGPPAGSSAPDPSFKPAGAAISAAAPRASFAALCDSLVSQLTQDDALQKSISTLPNDTSGVRNVLNKAYQQAADNFADQMTATRNHLLQQQDDCRDQIENLCDQISPLVNVTAKSGETLHAKNTWDNVMRFVRADDQLRRGLAASNAREAQRDEIRKNQIQAITLLKEIKSSLDTLAPASAP
ncbi:MAG TPA: hypothetical protein VHC95_11790 [Opitutales bacterium]|nr:hypothetical protein [Opitutales bacterium]